MPKTRLLCLTMVIAILAITAACNSSDDATGRSTPASTATTKPAAKPKPLSAEDQATIDTLRMRINVTNERQSLKDLREICKMRALVSNAAAKRTAIRLFVDHKKDPNDYSAMDFVVGVANGTCDWRTGK